MTYLEILCGGLGFFIPSESAVGVIRKKRDFSRRFDAFFEPDSFSPRGGINGRSFTRMRVCVSVYVSSCCCFSLYAVITFDLVHRHYLVLRLSSD